MIELTICVCSLFLACVFSETLCFFSFAINLFLFWKRMKGFRGKKEFPLGSFGEVWQTSQIWETSANDTREAVGNTFFFFGLLHTLSGRRTPFKNFFVCSVNEK